VVRGEWCVVSGERREKKDLTTEGTDGTEKRNVDRVEHCAVARIMNLAIIESILVKVEKSCAGFRDTLLRSIRSSR
jgi:hypothetical protein